MCKNSKTGCQCHIKDVNVVKTYNIGLTGAAGADGADGQTPYIGLNGNWWIGLTDTGTSASGGGSLNFIEGLNESGGNVKLGGTITEAILVGATNVTLELNPLTGSAGLSTRSGSGSGLTLSGLALDGTDVGLIRIHPALNQEQGFRINETNGVEVVDTLNNIGLTGAAIFTPVADKDYIQKIYVDNGFVRLSPSSPQSGYIDLIETGTGGGMPAGTNSIFTVGANGFLYREQQNTISGFKHRDLSISANFTGFSLTDRNDDSSGSVTVGITGVTLMGQDFTNSNKKKQITLQTSLPLVVLDEIDEIGLGDAADYSANKLPLSYITLSHAEALIAAGGGGGSLTSGSGAYIKAGKVNAGIDITTVGTTFDGVLDDGLFFFTQGVVTTSDHSSIQLIDDFFQVYKNKGGVLQIIEFGNAGAKTDLIRVTDDLSLRGLGDVADYSATKQALDYVTLSHVEALIAGGGSLLFENGINESGGIVKLGGALTGSTLIDADGNNLIVSGSGSVALTTDTVQVGSAGDYGIDFNGTSFPNLMVVFDGRSAGLRKGLEEAGDWSANKTALSYITLSHSQKVAGEARIFLTSGSVTMLTTVDVYVFDGGSPATFTLPTDVGNSGKTFSIKNTGSATLTIALSGTVQIYDTALVTTITLAAGASCHLTLIGTQYWIKY